MKYSSKTFNPLKSLKKLTICVMLVFVCINANAECKDFDKLAKIEGVEYQHVNKDMIKMGLETGEGLHLGEAINIDDEAGEILNRIDDVKVFKHEGTDNIEAFKKAALKVLKSKKWKSLMDTKSDDGQSVKIYQAKEGEQITNVVLVIQENEAGLVVIDGTLDIAKMFNGGYDDEDEDEDEDEVEDDEGEGKVVDMKDILKNVEKGDILFVINGEEHPELHSMKEADDYIKKNNIWFNHQSTIVGKALKEKYPNTDKKVVIEFSRIDKKEQK